MSYGQTSFREILTSVCVSEWYLLMQQPPGSDVFGAIWNWASANQAGIQDVTEFDAWQ